MEFFQLISDQIKLLFDGHPPPVEISLNLHQLLPDELVAKILVDDKEELKAAILSKDIHEATRQILVHRILYKPSITSEVRLECCGHMENDLTTRLLELFQDRISVGFVLKRDHQGLSFLEDHWHIKIISDISYKFINYTLDNHRHEVGVNIFGLDDGRYWYLINGHSLPVGVLGRPYESTKSDIADVVSLHQITAKRVKKFEIVNCDPRAVTIEKFRSQLEAFPHPLFKVAYLQLNMIRLNIVMKHQLSFWVGPVTHYTDVSAFEPMISYMEEMKSEIEKHIRSF